MVAGVRAARAVPRNWLGAERPVDPFDAKADALAALGAAGAPLASLQASAEGPAWYHPGRVGTLSLGRTVLATFGELHPGVVAALEAEGPMVGFEVMMDALPRPKAKATRAKPVLAASDYPAAERDFAFVLDAGVAAAEVERAARNAEKALIKRGHGVRRLRGLRHRGGQEVARHHRPPRGRGPHADRPGNRRGGGEGRRQRGEDDRRRAARLIRAPADGGVGSRP